MEDVVEVAAGLIVVFVFGLGVKPILEYGAGPEPTAPNGLEEQVWEGIVGRGTGGKWLGLLERFFSFGIFWLEAYEVLAVWLAFKVASKWEAWGNVVQVPTDLPDVDKTDYFRARNQLGSWLFTRFVSGTLLNVLTGLVGAALGRKAWHVLCLVGS